MYDAMLFDLDGTLIDTESLALVTGLAAFAAHGHAVDEAFMHGLVGKDEPTAARMIRAALPGVDLTAVNLHWREGFTAGVDDGLALKPGAALTCCPRWPLRWPSSPRPGRDGAHRKLGIAGIAEVLHPCRDAGRRDRARSPRPTPTFWPPPCSAWPRALPGVRRQRDRGRGRAPRRMHRGAGARRGAEPGPLGASPGAGPSDRRADGRADLRARGSLAKG